MITLLPYLLQSLLGDTFADPSFCLDLPKSVPIIPETNESYLHELSHEKQQLPLKLSLAITIHKSQGLTINKTWIDLGKYEKLTGLTCVGLSRIRKLDDLIVEPLMFESLNLLSSIEY